MARRLASLDAAAEYIGVTTRTLRRWIADGDIVAYRLGRRIVRIDLDEVDDKLCKPVPNAKAG